MFIETFGPVFATLAVFFLALSTFFQWPKDDPTGLVVGIIIAFIAWVVLIGSVFMRAQNMVFAGCLTLVVAVILTIAHNYTVRKVRGG